MGEKFCLKWNDFQTNVSKSFGILRNEEYLHDVTLVCDDNSQVSAHKLVLSACSDFFKTIFRNNSHPNPLLCLEGVSSQELRNILVEKVAKYAISTSFDRTNGKPSFCRWLTFKRFGTRRRKTKCHAVFAPFSNALSSLLKFHFSLTLRLLLADFGSERQYRFSSIRRNS